MPGLGAGCTARAQGAPRAPRRSEAERSRREELELSLALLSFLHGSGNVAINTRVRREGTATQKHSAQQLLLALPLFPSWLI